MPENGELRRIVLLGSSLIFCRFEESMVEIFWKWIQSERGNAITDYIKEPDADVTYNYDISMPDKVYDIIVYFCGHRAFNLVKLNPVNEEYRRVFLIELLLLFMISQSNGQYSKQLFGYYPSLMYCNLLDERQQRRF